MNDVRTISQIIEPRTFAKVLALQKERQSVRREEEFDRVRNLESESVRVDQEIDRQVYFLYGLTDEEIKIVEGQ